MDVAVPDSVAPHHHDGIPQSLPSGTEFADPVVFGLQEEHHLIASAVGGGGSVGVVGPGHGRTHSRRGVDGRRVGQRTAVHCGRHRVQKQQEPRSPSIHHVGPGQLGQQLGRAIKRGPAGLLASLHHLDEAVDPLLNRLCGGGGHVSDNSENGALHRGGHRLIGRGRSLLQRTGQHRRVDVAGGGHRVGETPQDLRQDHARIAPGTHQRAMADGVAHLAHLVPGGRHLGYHRFQGERHIGAGIAVGNRVDIQLVDDVAVHAEGVSEPLHSGSQSLGAQAVCRHDPRCYRGLR